MQMQRRLRNTKCSCLLPILPLLTLLPRRAFLPRLAFISPLPPCYLGRPHFCCPGRQAMPSSMVASWPSACPPSGPRRLAPCVRPLFCPTLSHVIKDLTPRSRVAPVQDLLWKAKDMPGPPLCSLTPRLLLALRIRRMSKLLSAMPMTQPLPLSMVNLSLPLPPPFFPPLPSNNLTSPHNRSLLMPQSNL